MTAGKMTAGLVAAMLVSGLGSAAWAVEVKQTASVKGKAAAVWAEVGPFCAIEFWHPALAECEQLKEGGDVRRILTLKNGGKIREKLTGSTATSYSYTIEESPLPVKNYNATFAVMPDPADKDAVSVVWSAKFEAKDKSDKEAAAVIEKIFADGLKGITEGMKAN